MSSAIVPVCSGFSPFEFRTASRLPLRLMLDVMAKTATPLLYIMPKKIAETDPNQQITDYTGSGPFTYNKNETQMGQRYVYDRFPNYVPRSEPASGMAGAKNVKVDRVVYENMPDSQTALQALKAGEIDFFEISCGITSIGEERRYGPNPLTLFFLVIIERTGKFGSFARLQSKSEMIKNGTRVELPGGGVMLRRAN